MRALLPFIRLVLKYWLSMLLGALLGLVTLVSGIGLLSLSGWFIASAGFAGLSAATAIAFNYLLPSGGVRFFSLTRIAGRYGERLVTHEATFKILSRLRVWVYEHVEPLAPAHLLQYRSGGLLNRLIHDVDALDNLYIRALTPTLLAIFVSVLMLFFLHFFNAQLAWIVFILFIATTILTPIIVFVLGKKPGKNLQRLIANLRIALVAYLQGIKTFLLFGADQKKLDEIDQLSHQLINTQAKMALIKGFASAFMTAITGMTIFVALYIGVGITHRGAMNGANLALISLAILTAFEAILPITQAFQYLGKTIAAAKRLLTIAQAQPAVKFVTKSKTSLADASITFREVSFAYDQRKPVFHQFNLTIQAGEKVAIVGPTGAGKSTLIHLLSRVFDPQQGSVSIGQVDIRKLSETDLRRSMSIISQNPYIFNDTIRNNLLLANPKASDEQLFQALKKVKLYDDVVNLPDGLNTWLGEAGERFSGGQIRRLAVARAILHHAPIWVFDEPTESLDHLTQIQLLDELVPLMKLKTVLIVSHRHADLFYVNRLIRLAALN